MASENCFNPSLKGILVYDQEDEMCVNLNHNIKVFFKTNGYFMVKNYADNNTIAVAAPYYRGDTSMFVFKREGVKIYHTPDEILIVDYLKIVSSIEKKFTYRMFYHEGKYRKICKMSNAFPNLYSFLTCEQLFNIKNNEITEEIKERAIMLYNTCSYVNDNGDIDFKFENGLHINQHSSGHTKITFDNKKGRIIINPKGTLNLFLNDISIKSTESNIIAKHGDTCFVTRDDIPISIFGRRYSTNN